MGISQEAAGAGNCDCCDPAALYHRAESAYNSGSLIENPADLKYMELLFKDSDQFLDFAQCEIPSQVYEDSIDSVPAPGRSSENRFIIDFAGSSYYPAPPLGNSVSSPSMEAGVVPDGSEIPCLNSSGDNQVSQVVGMDREARVLRYREKRKNRRFEKTIRYASRKAYAETRPRIKGRFAKRTGADAGYGVIPSF